MNDVLSNIDKFSYLGSLLLGSAKSAVGGFALTSANYESAIELLKKRYGKKGHDSEGTNKQTVDCTSRVQ